MFRWLKRGAPLDRPAEMPGWWERERLAGRLTWACPEKVLVAAREARIATGEDGPLFAAAGASSVKSGGGDLAPSAKSGVAVPAASVDLRGFRLEAGEAVKQQQRIVAALYQQLETAYLEPGKGDVDLLQTKYHKAVEALRKLEKDDRADAERRGDLVPAEALQRDLETFAELMRQMDDSTARRLNEMCPSLSLEQREELGRAWQSIVPRRANILRNLATVRDLRQVEEMIAA